MTKVFVREWLACISAEGWLFVLYTQQPVEEYLILIVNFYALLNMIIDSGLFSTHPKLLQFIVGWHIFCDHKTFCHRCLVAWMVAALLWHYELQSFGVLLVSAHPLDRGVDVLVDELGVDGSCWLQRQCYEGSVWLWLLAWSILVVFECAELGGHSGHILCQGRLRRFSSSLIMDQDRLLLCNDRLRLACFQSMPRVSVGAVLLRLVLLLVLHLLQGLLTRFTRRRWFSLFLISSCYCRLRLSRYLFGQRTCGRYCLFLFCCWLFLFDDWFFQLRFFLLKSVRHFIARNFFI